MRILIASNYQPPHMGGIEFAAAALKDCWLGMGHEVTWVTSDEPRGAREAGPDNVRIRTWNGLEHRFQINSPLPYPSEWSRLTRLVAAHDVVNAHSLAPGVASATLLAAARARKPLVVTQHVGVIRMGGLMNAVQEKFITGLARHSIRHGAYLTFVGQAVRDWFVERARIPQDRIVMTPAGIDRRSYHFVPDGERVALRAKWGLRDDALNLLFVGRFYEKKGLPLIADLARRLPGVRFTLVGGGPIEPAKWNLPNIRVISFVSTEELRELYGAHDLFIMPSYGEGWPAVVPQAMACGLACLVSEECFTGHHRDADRFLVCRRTADDIAPVLERAAAGSLEILRDRRALSDFATRTWDWQRTAEIYTGLFGRLLGSPAPRP